MTLTPDTINRHVLTDTENTYESENACLHVAFMPEKICLRGTRPGPAQTGLYSHKPARYEVEGRYEHGDHAVLTLMVLKLLLCL